MLLKRWTTAMLAGGALILLGVWLVDRGGSSSPRLFPSSTPRGGGSGWG
jgi:hypothetical protein